jgi:hypothetical protein
MDNLLRKSTIKFGRYSLNPSESFATPICSRPWGVEAPAPRARSLSKCPRFQPIVTALRQKPKAWVNFMMRFELRSFG